MPLPVVLHIYDLTEVLNKGLMKLGTGAFHGGVEVGGKEWSYGFIEQGTGVFSCKPKGCDFAKFRESIEIGETNMSEDEVKALIAELKEAWPGIQYDLLRRNCVVFCNEFCEKLGVGPVPSWVTNLAGAGATILNGTIRVGTQAQKAAIIAAAKANEVDAKYNIKGQAQAKAEEFLEAMKNADKQYQIKDTAKGLLASASVVAGTAAAKASEKAKEFQDKGGIAGAASKAAQKAGEKAKEFEGKGGAVGQLAAAASKAAQKAGEKAEQVRNSQGAGSSSGGVTEKSPPKQDGCKCS